MSRGKTDFWGARKFDIAARLWRAQKGCCAYCGKPVALRKSTLDHVMPLAVGGLDVEHSLLVTCEPCNKAKGNSLPTLEFHESIRRRIHSILNEAVMKDLAPAPKSEVNCGNV